MFPSFPDEQEFGGSTFHVDSGGNLSRKAVSRGAAFKTEMCGRGLE